MVKRDLSANTINSRLAALRSLVKLARTLGMIGWAIDVGNVKAGPTATRPVAAAMGYRRLLDYLDRRGDPKTDPRSGHRPACCSSGPCARNEVASLDVEHLDLDAGTVSVLGKGHTDRESLTLPEPTRRALADWLAIRGTEPGPLFTNLDRARKGTGRLTGAGIWAIVTALGEATGQTVRPHGLRHAAITTALDATHGDVRAVQRFSRHAKVDTVLVYDDARRDIGGDVAKLVAG